MRRSVPAVLGIAALAVAVIPAFTAQAGAADTNLVAGMSFNGGTTGWFAQKGATLSLDSAGTAAHVTATASTPAILNDDPATVQSTVAGTRYRADVRVRAATTGLPITLRLNEYNGNKNFGSATGLRAVTNTWTDVQVDYVATTTGAKLGITISAEHVTAGQSYDVDSVSVVQVARSPWALVYRNDFTSMSDVSPYQSAVSANDQVRATDTTNSQLQKPTLRSNVGIVSDAAASDGSALSVSTRPATYQTSGGVVTGWSNGRMQITGHDEAPPVRIRTRLKMTPSAGTKSAVMWWPAGGGWPWEVDFAETFGGTSTQDYWGSRHNVAERWHADINHDGAAREQLTSNVAIDATAYHVYDLNITPTRMWIEIDGVKAFETTDARYIPTGAGFFSVGKALTGSRQSATRTDDAVSVDWLEIYRPTA